MRKLVLAFLICSICITSMACFVYAEEANVSEVSEYSQKVNKLRVIFEKYKELLLRRYENDKRNFERDMRGIWMIIEGIKDEVSDWGYQREMRGILKGER